MAKNVTVWLKDGGVEKYLDVSVEEDRYFEHVTAIRLYEQGELRAKLDYNLINRIEVIEAA